MKKRGFTEDEKALVEYLKDKLKQRGVLKLPRDWHLKQSTVARDMLAGEKAPSLEEWKACIDWLMGHKYWGDKVDHLYRISSLWAQYILQAKRTDHTVKGSQESDRRKEIIKKLYLS